MTEMLDGSNASRARIHASSSIAHAYIAYPTSAPAAATNPFHRPRRTVVGAVISRLHAVDMVATADVTATAAHDPCSGWPRCAAAFTTSGIAAPPASAARQ